MSHLQCCTDLVSPSIRDLQKECCRMQTQISLCLAAQKTGNTTQIRGERQRETEFYIYSPAMHRYTIYDI